MSTRLVRVLYSHFFFFNDTATTEIYTLSLHDALPIWASVIQRRRCSLSGNSSSTRRSVRCRSFRSPRSEEHTSELQSQSNLVCRLLLEKKKKTEAPGPPQDGEYTRTTASTPQV